MIQAINKEYNLDEMKEEAVDKTNFTWFYSEDGALRPRVLAVDVYPAIRNMYMCDMERQHILVDPLTFDLSRVVYQLQCMLSANSPKCLQLLFVADDPDQYKIASEIAKEIGKKLRVQIDMIALISDWVSERRFHNFHYMGEHLMGMKNRKDCMVYLLDLAQIAHLCEATNPVGKTTRGHIFNLAANCLRTLGAPLRHMLDIRSFWQPVVHD